MESVNWRKYAKKQIDYLLGSSGRSFVVDYGVQYPTQPFHKGASCPNRPLACSTDRYRDTENANVQVLAVMVKVLHAHFAEFTVLAWP